MRFRRALAGSLVVAGVVLLFACSQTYSYAPPLGDQPHPPNMASTSTDGGTTLDVALGEAGLCTQLPLPGAYVTELYVAQDIPTQAGGALVDGVYVLTDAKIYTGQGGMSGPANVTLKSTAVLAGNQLRLTVAIQGGNTTSQAYTFVQATADGGAPNTLLDCTLACDTAGTAVTRSAFFYSMVTGSTGTTLILAAQNITNTFVKQ